MSRPVAYLAVSVALLLSLAGCALSMIGFERRAEWHDREERACMMRREVRATPWVQFDRGLDGRGACGILKPVKIAALGEGTIAMGPTATLNCPMTAAVERWLGEAVQPAAVAWFGAPVVSIKQISSYACRPRNNERGESLSEHAYGNALDVAAFTLADGRTVTVKGDWAGPDANARGFLREVFAAGCRGFRTALGPGVKYHNDHFHFDLAHHDKAGTSRYCRPVIDAPPRRPSGSWLVAQSLDWGNTGSVSSDEDEIGELLADMPPDVAANLDDPFGVSILNPDAYSPLD
jgi:hypothetical protein